MKPSRHHSTEIINAVCGLYGAKSAFLVGEEFGLSKNAVVGIWHRNRRSLSSEAAEKKRSRSRRYVHSHSKEFVRAVCGMYGKLHYAQAAAELSISPDAIRAIWHRHLSADERIAPPIVKRALPRPAKIRVKPVKPAPELGRIPRPRAAPETVFGASDYWSATTLSLMGRPSDVCTYLSDDPPSGIYCCEPVVPGASMCWEHYARCRVPSQGKPRPYVQRSITGRAA